MWAVPTHVFDIISLHFHQQFTVVRELSSRDAFLTFSGGRLNFARSFALDYSQKRQYSPYLKKIHAHFWVNYILSYVGVTYKTGFRFGDWIYGTLYIHNSGLQAIQRYR
jgi:hypothetical protein